MCEEFLRCGDPTTQEQSDVSETGSTKSQRASNGQRVVTGSTCGNVRRDVEIHICQKDVPMRRDCDPRTLSLP